MLGKLNGPNIDFLNEVERIFFANRKSFKVFDPFVASVILFPECIRKQFDCYATVELNGKETRGQMCVGHRSKKPANVTVIEYLNEEAVKNALIFAADATDMNGNCTVR